MSKVGFESSPCLLGRTGWININEVSHHRSGEGDGDPEMNSVCLRPLSESLGEKQQEVRLTNPQCLVLFIPSHKISLGSMLSRNHCGLVREKVSRVRSGSRVGTYSYLVSERGQTGLHRASVIFCWFAALLL